MQSPPHTTNVSKALRVTLVTQQHYNIQCCTWREREGGVALRPTGWACPRRGAQSQAGVSHRRHTPLACWTPTGGTSAVSELHDAVCKSTGTKTDATPSPLMVLRQCARAKGVQMSRTPATSLSSNGIVFYTNKTPPKTKPSHAYSRRSRGGRPRRV